MQLVSNRDREFLEGLRAQIRPMLLLADAEERIAAFLFDLVRDSCDRAMTQTLEEMHKLTKQALSGRRKLMAMRIAEGEGG